MTSSATFRHPRSQLLGGASVLLLALALHDGTAWAQTADGGTGGVAGTTGAAGQNAAGTGGAGGAGGVLPGASGSDGLSGVGGGGGGGGGGQYGNGSGGTAALINTGALAGGNGGNGGAGSSGTGVSAGQAGPGGAADQGGRGGLVLYGDIGGDGGGGAGGGGALVTGNGGASSNSGTIQGGRGGNGGGGVFGTLAGSGGGGGSGVIFTGIGNAFTNVTSSIVSGGQGGATSPAFFPVGNGGSGGHGISGNELTVSNSGIISGGSGGTGGSISSNTGGRGGDGINGTGLTITNNAGAAISGGNGGLGTGTGPVGAGGSGISGSNVTIVNAGAIIGGLDGSSALRANALTFTGGINRLELQAGWSLTGKVNAFAGISNTLALGGAANSSFAVSNIGSQFLGFRSFEKTGSSTWSLTGTTFASTPWSILQGTLQISSDRALGFGTLTIANGATLATTTRFTSGRAIMLNAGGGTFDVAPGTTLSMSGPIDGAGGLTKANGGTLVLSGANTYSGATTIAAGTLQLGNGGTSGSIVGDVLDNGTLAFNRSDTVTFPGVISGSGAVNQIGSGTTILTATNSYGGGTLLQSGMLSVSSDSNLGAASGGLTFNGGTLQVTGTNFTSTTRTINWGGGGFDIADPANAFTVNQTLDGNGALTKLGAGTLTLAGSNSYSGGTTVAGGTLSIYSDGNLGNGGTLALLNGTTLAFTQGGLYTHAITVAGDPTFDVATGQIVTQSGAISDGASPGDVVKTGAGTLILTANNIYSGGTTVSAGTLQLGNGGTSGSILGDVVNNSTLAFNRSDVVTFTGNISGSGAVQQSGSGTTILTGANSYGGGTLLQNGVLSVSSNANLGAATGGVTFAGGTLATTASFDAARSIALTQAARFDIASGTELGLVGVMKGSGDLIKLGGGKLRLDDGANAYGNTLVAAGTLVGNAGSISGNIGNAGTVIFNQVNGESFAGDIAALNGTRGVMVKQGAGTLTLLGASSLDWTLTGGGLLTAAERFGGNAAIGTGASLTFDQSADAAYAGVLSGSGGFNKSSVGLLNLTGDSSAFTGSTFVRAGTLAVNGTLGGTLDVLSGARLQGIGTVGHTNVNAGGVIAPGNGSIGVLAVQGNLTMAAGSHLATEIDATGASSRVAVSGTANIAGAMLDVSANGSKLARYTILTTTDGLTGTFGTLTGNIGPLSTFVGVTASYDADNAYLDVSRVRDFADAGQTRNQKAAATGIQSLTGGNPFFTGNSLYNAVLALPTDAQARNAFDQVSGEVHASAKTAVIEDSRFVRDAMNDRLRAAFDAVGAVQTPVMAYAEGGPVLAPATTDRFALWGRAFGSWGSTNSDGNAARLTRSTGGFFVGGDAPIFDTWRLGMVAGYSRTDFNVRDRRSSGTSDNYHLGLYGGTTWGNLSFRTGAAYTWHDISTSRGLIFPGFGDSLKGKYAAATAQVFGELAYGLDAGRARFEPFGNLAYVNLQTDGFRESGGAAALSSYSGSTDATFSTLGLRASTSFMLGDINTAARGTLGWRHAFGNVTPLSTFTFAGGAPFTIVGVSVAKNAAVVEAGLDFAIAPSATLGVSYSGQFASGVSDQSVRGTFNWKF